MSRGLQATNLPRHDRSRAKCGRTRPGSAHHRIRPANLGPSRNRRKHARSSANLSRHRQTRSTLSNTWPASIELAVDVLGIRPLSVRIGPTWRGLGRFLPESVEVRPILPRIRPAVGELDRCAQFKRRSRPASSESQGRARAGGHEVERGAPLAMERHLLIRWSRGRGCISAGLATARGPIVRCGTGVYQKAAQSCPPPAYGGGTRRLGTCGTSTRTACRAHSRGRWGGPRSRHTDVCAHRCARIFEKSLSAVVAGAPWAAGHEEPRVEAGVGADGVRWSSQMRAGSLQMRARRWRARAPEA